jgi:hypothetical protein
MNTEKVVEEKVIELGKVSEETKGTFPHGSESADLNMGFDG